MTDCHPTTRKTRGGRGPRFVTRRSLRRAALKLCDPLPTGIGSGFGWPLGGPSVAQGPPKRHARATQGSIDGLAFVFNKSWKKAGWGAKRSRKDKHLTTKDTKEHKGRSGDLVIARDLVIENLVTLGQSRMTWDGIVQTLWNPS